MPPLKLYLDTSVLNFLFADDAPELQRLTREFFDGPVKSGRYEVFISQVVLDEIELTRDEIRRGKLLSAIGEYRLGYLGVDAEVEKLAEIYLNEGVLSRKNRNDARHLATATHHEMDVLLSWNFKHLANLGRRIKVEAINKKHNLHPLILANPMEALDENG